MRVKLQEAYIQGSMYTDTHERKRAARLLDFRVVFVNPEQVVSIRENREYSKMDGGKTFSTIETTRGVVHVVGNPEQVEEQLKSGKQLLNG